MYKSETKEIKISKSQNLMRSMWDPRLPKFPRVRHLATWTPLSSALNTKPRRRLEVLRKKDGLFGIPELRKYQGFYKLKDQCFERADKLVTEATSNKRRRKLVEVFDELSDTICKVADVAELIRNVHPFPPFVYTAGIASLSVATLVDKLNTNKSLYRNLKYVVTHGDFYPWDEEDLNVGRLFLLDFELNGIHLKGRRRREVVELLNKNIVLGQEFTSNSQEPKILDKVFIPVAVSDYFQFDEDKVIVDKTNSHCPNVLAREVAYKYYYSPNLTQETTLRELLKTRHQVATLCGFKSYAHRTLVGSVMETPEKVMNFLKGLAERIKPHASKDFQVLEDYKNLEAVKSVLRDQPPEPPHRESWPLEDKPFLLAGRHKPLAMYDVEYYSEQIKMSYLGSQVKTYKEYFSLGACMEGLNKLFSNLFGITLENVEVVPGETWTKSIYKLAVVHEKEGLLGFIYCDFYERVGKSPMECHYTVQGGKRLNPEEYQLPIVAVIMNLTPPALGKPSLLSIHDLDSLFHEMGHAMHSMLGRTKYQHVTGTRCSTDFAEVPSILMEYFSNDIRVLKSFACHHSTMEPIPDDLITNISSSREFFTASEIHNQMVYSILDQIYHGTDPPSDTSATLRAVHKKYHLLPLVEGTAPQLRFNHLVIYGAKFYSYLVCRALASCIWQTYFSNDPFDRDMGQLYRDNCLSFGGGKPPFFLIKDYLKKEPTPELLVDFLVKEIESRATRLPPVTS